MAWLAASEGISLVESTCNYFNIPDGGLRWRNRSRKGDLDEGDSTREYDELSSRRKMTMVHATSAALSCRIFMCLQPILQSCSQGHASRMKVLSRDLYCVVSVDADHANPVTP